jgi:hypothetical protein
MPVEFSHEILIEQCADEAIQLFTPKGEESWVPEWRPNYIWPQTGEICRDIIFETGSGGEATLWACLEWQPDERCVRYLRTTPGSRIAFVEVCCRAHGTGHAIARVTYRYVALSDSGDELIAAMSPISFARMIDDWAAMIGRRFQERPTPSLHHPAH